MRQHSSMSALDLLRRQREHGLIAEFFFELPVASCGR